MRVAAWNIQQGGFEHGYDEIGLVPERLPVIRDGVCKIGADTIGLIDTWRWAEIFSPAELCEYFGYTQAFPIDMHATRVRPSIDPRVGITVMTHDPAASMQAVWLGSRNCVRVSLSGMDRLAWIYFVYLDDVYEDARMDQARWLAGDTDAHPGARICVAGDLNALPPNSLGLLWQLGCAVATSRPALWVANKTRGRVSYSITALGEIARAEVVPWLRKRGFSDLACSYGVASVATASPRIGILRFTAPVDRILTRTWPHSGYRIWTLPGSDHRAVSADLTGLHDGERSGQKAPPGVPSGLNAFLTVRLLYDIVVQ